jgi:hypothetical protein
MHNRLPQELYDMIYERPVIENWAQRMAVSKSLL